MTWSVTSKLQRRPSDLGRLRGCELSVAYQALQHVSNPLRRRGQMRHRVERAGRLHHGGEQRRLGPVNCAGATPK